MGTYAESIEFETGGEVQIINITEKVGAAVARSGIQDGIACVFSTSSTSAIMANEYEPGLMEEDVPGALERLFPRDIRYGHEERWHDGNGHSHVRATFMGPSLSVPVAGGRPVLGTWQQVCFVELDNKPRHRRVRVQVVGE
jgi:secondary thiamine-phosphate synthase enzyme